jgi:2-phosphoglycerate kinase
MAMIKEPLLKSFKKSFPDSVARYFPFRLVLACAAPLLIVLGKDSMVSI